MDDPSPGARYALAVDNSVDRVWRTRGCAVDHTPDTMVPWWQQTAMRVARWARCGGSPSCSNGAGRRPTRSRPSGRRPRRSCLSATRWTTRVRAGTLQELPGIGASTAEVIEAAVEGRVPDRLARLEREVGGPLVDGGERVRAAIRGDLHSHSDWSDGGSPIEEMAFTAIELGHDYLVLTDHSPRLRVANGLSVARLTRQLGVVEAVNEHLGGSFQLLKGIEVDILDDGSLDQTDEMLARLDVRVASVHSKLAMDKEPMTRRMVAAVHNPFTNVLGHCTGRLGDRQPRHAQAVGVRRRAGLRCLPRDRDRRRDQLPARATRPAHEAAAPGDRDGVPVLDRQRRSRSRPAGLPGLRLRPGRGARTSTPTGSSTPGHSTGCWSGPGPDAPSPLASSSRA